MAQINVSNLSFAYEGCFDNIFENVSFSIDTEWKLGFIGRNGKGKTTFLKLLQGNYEYNGTIRTSTVFDYFPYTVTADQTILPAAEFTDDLKPKCELWRVICELEKLGENAEILYRPFHTLSPGEQTKILLAVLFSGENDFLLIDEPTNHLDENSRTNVKNYLCSKKGFLLVSHDRDLLDACTDHVLVLNRRTIEIQNGNFSSWWENKRRKDAFAAAENKKHRKEIEKLKQAAKQSFDWAEQNERTKIGFDPVKEHDRPTRAYIGAKTKTIQSRAKQMNRRIHRELEAAKDLLCDLEETVDLKVNPLIHHKKTLVNIRDYSVKYKGADRPAFTGLTFQIDRGDRIALHGKNGCGKSTLLSLICGLITPESGEIIYEGTNITESSRQRFGYMLQKDHLFEWRTIRRNILLGLEIQKKLSRETGAYADKLLETYGLSAFAQKRPSELSGGMRQRAALIRTLVLKPELLLLDEPFSALDYQTRLKVSDDIGTIIRQEKKTAILVTHDLSEAISMGDKVLVLSKRPGKIKTIVPISLDKNLSPLEKRNCDEFKTYFNLIWKEFESNEAET